jgi:regulator of protease activity HflC (stomatin/prohibitin superfamily)
MDAPQGLVFVFYLLVAFFAIGTILKGFFQVRTAEAVVIQRMGKFLRVATAGINFKLPWLDQDGSICGCNSSPSTLRLKPKTTCS